jgi:hypothetical protein
MSRFTSRDALGIWVKGYANNDETATHFPYYEDELYEAVEKLAYYEDLEEQGRLIEQKYGQWDYNKYRQMYCSNCGECPEIAVEWNYCPNCGAKMKVVEK